MSIDQSRPNRSALYLPASNARAIEKARQLPADVIIFDLEDAVAPGMKDQARENLLKAFSDGGFGRRRLVIRVNHVDTSFFERDSEVAAACGPDAILVPKVSSGKNMADFAERLAARGFARQPALWAMIETAEALTKLPEIATAGATTAPRLECLIVGTNDIARETGVSMGYGRAYFIPWLMNIVLTAKVHGLTVLDGVWNDFRDISGYQSEAKQSQLMGFDGKTLIHPSQIDFANEVFAPSAAELDEARSIVEAFARPENVGAGVINLDGKMVELLHLEMARRTLSLHEAIRANAAA